MYEFNCLKLVATLVGIAWYWSLNAKDAKLVYMIILRILLRYWYYNILTSILRNLIHVNCFFVLVPLWHSNVLHLYWTDCGVGEDKIQSMSLYPFIMYWTGASSVTRVKSWRRKLKEPFFGSGIERALPSNQRICTCMSACVKCEMLYGSKTGAVEVGDVYM